MEAVILCGGTLQVDHPDAVLLDYVDVRNGFAYPSYDRLETNGQTSLVDADLLAPNLIGAEVDRGRFALLREMLPDLAGISRLPDTPMETASDADLEQVADLFAVLDRPPYAGTGSHSPVRGTILSKVLHRKRPDLVPLYDSRIFESYTAPGAIPRSAHRTWREFMLVLCQQMRADLQGEQAAFTHLQEQAADAGAVVSPLRILDILVWRTADAWH